MRFEIQAHRANDELTLRRLLAAAPSSVELDVGVAGGELIVAHDTDLGDARGLRLEQALAAAGETPLVVEAKCFPPATPSPRAFAQALRPHLERIQLCSFEPQALLGGPPARRGPRDHLPLRFADTHDGGRADDRRRATTS